MTPSSPDSPPLLVQRGALWLTHTTPHTRVREVALCGDLIHTNRRAMRRALTRFGARCPKTHEEKARAHLLVLGQGHDSELMQRFQARAQPIVPVEAFLRLIGHPLDANAHLAQLRALVHRPPDRQTWADIVALLDRWPADASPELGARYAAAHLDAWPDALRTLPKHWQARAQRGEPTPWIQLARVVSWYERRGRRSGDQRARLRRLIRALGAAPLHTLGLNIAHHAPLCAELGRAIAQAPCTHAVHTLTLTGDRRNTPGIDALHGWRALDHAQRIHLGLFDHTEATLAPLFDSMHRATRSPQTPHTYRRGVHLTCTGTTATPAIFPALSAWALRAQPRVFTFGSNTLAYDDYRALQRMSPFNAMHIHNITTQAHWNSITLTQNTRTDAA